MNTIMVVSARQESFTMLSSNFSHLPVHFSWNKSIPDALDDFAFEQPFILFLISSRTEQIVDWMEEFNSSAFSIPIVVFSSATDWADREMLWNLKVSDIVELPRSRKELEYIMQAFLVHAVAQEESSSHQMKGRLQDFSVLDLIESFVRSKKSGTVLLENISKKGQLEFNKGKLVNASFTDCDPVESVCVLSTWNKGLFFGRFETKKYKENIVLDTEQITAECLSYKKKTDKLIRKLPDLNSMMFTDPDIEYEEFGPKDREILQKFRYGYRLDKFLDDYQGSWKFILKKFALWVDRKWLLEEDTYRILMAKIKADQRKSAFRKMFDRVFSEKDEEIDMPNLEIADEDAEDFFPEEEKYISLFKQDELLKSFPDIDSGLLEIPIIIDSEEELNLFLDGLDFEPVAEFPDLTCCEIRWPDNKRLLLYQLKDLYSKSSWADYDVLISKSPFIFILTDKDSAVLQTIIKRLENRYETPFYFLTSEQVDDNKESTPTKKISEINDNQLVLFKNTDENKIVQAVQDAIKLYHQTSQITEELPS